MLLVYDYLELYGGNAQNTYRCRLNFRMPGHLGPNHLHLSGGLGATSEYPATHLHVIE